MISVVLPVIEAGEDLEFILVAMDKENSVAGAMDKAAILATGVQGIINLTGLQGSGYK